MDNNLEYMQVSKAFPKVKNDKVMMQVESSSSLHTEEISSSISIGSETFSREESKIKDNQNKKSEISPISQKIPRLNTIIK